jgi:hypothetical protein
MKDNTVQKFKIVLPILKTRVVIRKDEQGNEKEVRFVEGVASSTDKDLHGDRMAPSAIKTMADSLKYHDVALNADHDTTWSAEIGPIVKLEVTPDNDLTLEAELSEMSKANDLWYALTKNKKKLGLSIGGYVKEYEMVKEEADPDSGEENAEPHWYRLYKDIDLDHVAVTSSPANPKTWVSAISKSMDPAKDQLLMEAVMQKEQEEKEDKKTEDKSMQTNKDKEMKDLAIKVARKIQDVEASLLLELTESVLITLDDDTVIKIKDYIDNVIEKKKNMKKDVSLEAEESLKKDDTVATPEGEAVEKPATLENEPKEEAPKTEEPKTEEPAKVEEPVEEPKEGEEVEAPAEPTEEKPAEEKPAEEAPSEEKPVEEKPTESEPAEEEPKKEEAESEDSSGEEGKDEEGEKPTEPVAPVEDAGKPEEPAEKTEDKSVDNGAELLKAVQVLTDGMKVMLESNKTLTDRVAELEAQPASRKTVELEKGVGDEAVDAVDGKSLTEEMEEKIAKVRKDNYGNPNLFAMTQKIRAEYSKKASL